LNANVQTFQKRGLESHSNGISLSLIGAGIAFALQQVILSFAAWFLIIIKRPYKIGDRIYIKGKDILGDVEEMRKAAYMIKQKTPESVQCHDKGEDTVLPKAGACYQERDIQKTAC
jgi:hypothetical protein